jgi:cobyrinic acid a,c-diamide synthase
MKPQILIGAVTSGSGKTIFAMGLLRLLKKRGMEVQGYKIGPDFVDSLLLSLACGNDTVNLDAWMSSQGHVQYLYNKYGEQADVCIAEGTAGLFDGYRRMQGSSIEAAGLLNLPVVLLVNARLAGYSVAPLIYGFKNFYSGSKIVGVVFNQVASVAHYTFLREACADVGVDCLGYLPIMDNCKLPAKHSAISSVIKNGLDDMVEKIAEQIEKTVEVNRLLNRCNRTFPCQYILPYSSDMEQECFIPGMGRMRIAVARDSAFNFVYRENMARLAGLGKVVYFSPLYGSALPEADLVYLPGGYPELFARQLHRRNKMMEDLKTYVEKGGKVLAEGGGMVYLGRTLKSREMGTAYPMCNVLPIDFILPSFSKLNAGYRMLDSSDQNLKGYEFRYTSVCKDDCTNLLFDPVKNMKGTECLMSLYRYKNVVASHTHWYWGDKNILGLWK